MAFQTGYDKNEACLTLNLCMQLNGTGIGNIPTPKPPPNWKRIFKGHNKIENESDKDTVVQEDRLGGKREKQDGLGPFDNAWELWHETGSKRYAIVIRGTVGDIGSIINDALATTLNSDGFLEVGKNGQHLPLLFSPIENGAVHLGFCWGAAILMFHNTMGILTQLLSKVAEDDAEIYVIGHSQGAAIATLLHALLFYAGDTTRGGTTNTPLQVKLGKKKFTYKSYVFAQPKPGNWQFGQDYEQIAGNKGMAWCINNSRDWVPQVPFSIGLPDDLTGNPIPPFLKTLGALGIILSNSLIGFASMARAIRRQFGEWINDRLKHSRQYLYEHMDTSLLSSETGGNSSSASLNYLQCGQLVSLQGKNEPEEATDAFWQHHLQTYKRLMNC